MKEIQKELLLVWQKQCSLLWMQFSEGQKTLQYARVSFSNSLTQSLNVGIYKPHLLCFKTSLLNFTIMLTIYFLDMIFQCHKHHQKAHFPHQHPKEPSHSSTGQLSSVDKTFIFYDFRHLLFPYYKFFIFGIYSLFIFLIVKMLTPSH